MRPLLARLRSWFFFTPAYGLATVAYGAASFACSRWDATGSRQHRIARAWARMLLRIAGVRVTVVGGEWLHEPAAQRPCVLVCNHLSYMDVPVLFATLPLQFRILARQGLFKIPFLGGHLRRAQHLPVDQANPRAAFRSLLQATTSVSAGLPVFIFPEAGRSFEGELRPFVNGAFMLAIQAQVPIVPMVLAGTWELLPPGSFILRPRPVTLIVSDPVSTAGLTRADAPALAARIHDHMQSLYAQYRPRPN